ncbi:MAG: hypothetical protein COA94_02425 [Rickettsiales bacterium]|nr:MAG: hypothetical protein COA94_02425 [Rickettsiales bacterium]
MRDFSRAGPTLPRDKFFLGEKHSLQIGSVKFPKGRGYSFDAVVFTRDGGVDSEGRQKKPFSFNLPAKLILPLHRAVTEIVTQAGLI